MAEYRKHWLINALGQRYDFTERTNSVFLHDPTGFGFQRSYISQRVGNSEIVTSQQFEMTDITGEILFFAGGVGAEYQQYREFIQFAKYKPLEFHYETPNDNASHFCDVIFAQADKSEISEDGILHIPVVFHRLTEWLNDNDIVVALTDTPQIGGKEYDLVRDYRYASTGLSNTSIYNDGTDEVGFVISIDGEVINPQFTLSQYGNTYGICKIDGTYDFVRINSVERTESIYLERNGSVVTNPEQYQDFTIRNGVSYLTWIKLRVGESKFAFTCGNPNGFDGTITISYKNSYATV